MRKYKREFNVYRIVNDVDEMVYVGSTTTELWHRMSQHRVDAAKGAKAPIYDLMRKYGAQHFKIEHICTSDPEHLRLDEERAILSIPQENRLNYKKTCRRDTSVKFDYKEICKVYLATGSQNQTANIIGCSRVTVQKALRKENVKIEYPPHTAHSIVRKSSPCQLGL